MILQLTKFTLSFNKCSMLRHFDRRCYSLIKLLSHREVVSRLLVVDSHLGSLYACQLITQTFGICLNIS